MCRAEGRRVSTISEPTKAMTAAKGFDGESPQRRLKQKLTLFFASFFAFLSFEFLNNSIKRLSYGANPATSRMIDLTKVFFSLKHSQISHSALHANSMRAGHTSEHPSCAKASPPWG